MSALIRGSVMPAVSRWTQVKWTQYYPANYASEKPPCFRWTFGDWMMDDVPCAGYTGLASVCFTEAACAITDAVLLYDAPLAHPPLAGRPKPVYPREVLLETMLHEALHAIFEAEHSTQGIMCERCYSRTVERDGWIWPLRPPLDDKVYSLYGNPAFTDGMTLDEVLSIVQVR